MNLMKIATVLLATPTIIIEFFPTQTLAGSFCVEEATIVEIQSAQQFRQLTASGLVEAYLSRINTYDKQGPNINSVLEMAADLIETASSSRFRTNRCMGFQFS